MQTKILISPSSESYKTYKHIETMFMFLYIQQSQPYIDVKNYYYL